MAERIADEELFRSLVGRAVADPATQSAVLSDASHQCAYPDIPGVLERIGRALSSRGVEPGHCLILEINNGVPAALTALALLVAGFSFMPSPAAGRGARAGQASAARPRFARWVVSVAPGTASLAEVSEWLHVEPNDAFAETAQAPPADRPRLFFRTSGSLGAAKLAAYTYRNFYRNALNAQRVRAFDPSDRIALPTPIYHVYGLGAGFLPGLMGGASIDFQDRSNVLRYLEREAEFQPNVAFMTPTFCEMLVRSRRSPRPYRYMITGGDCISESTFKRCEDLHGTLIGQYGATELGVVSVGSVDDPYETRAAGVGRPLEGVEVRIVNLPALRGHSDCGELQVRHAYGFEGYVDLDGRSLVPPNAFDDGWYRTGDLASMSDRGNLRIHGRCDLSVNRNGMLLPLAEVESRMRELDGVEEVAVVTADSETMRGKALVAFCVVGRRNSPSGQELRTRFAQRVAAFSVPDVVRVVAALPKLESGKVDRRALSALALQPDAASA
ncbi:MAG: acyl--CoA ligase [Gammaproteobacteria bacterium]|nr:acyl--CoA ligase [Gammaproteobacteria bacterium]